MPNARSPRSSSSSADARRSLVRLGESGDAWRFCPVAAQWLSERPDDAEVALLLSANLTRLGLRTPAGETLDACARLFDANDPNVAGVRAAIAALPADEISPAERIRRALERLEALEQRGIDLADAFDRWSHATRSERWFRAGDGNVVRRGPDGAWTRFADQRGEAERAELPGADAGEGPGAAERSVRPIYLEGADPPWLLLRLARRLPPGAAGYHAPIALIEPNVLALLDALALADLRSVLRQDRLSIFAGEGATDAFETFLHGRLAGEIAGDALTLARAAGGGTADPVRAIVDRACQAQRAALDRARASVEARSAGRDPAWWATRLDAARSVGGEPARVLIPTSRFTTYVRHAAEDIARAFERAGCVVETLMEPDDSSRLAALAYTEACERLDPDLVVLINYPRPTLGGAIPGNVPFVCWIQDAMPQLLDRRAGEASGPLDFLVGCLDRAYFQHFGQRPGRHLPLPVLASAAKLHDAPVDGARRERFDCEIACVTNHSETPEAQRDRLIAASGDPRSGRAIRAIWDGCVALRDDLMSGSVETRLRDLVRAALEGAGARADEADVSRALATHARPMLDRLIRHQTLGWATDIARRRDWRMHLYGRGWKQHPTLRAHARGVLRHGEDLRSAYQAAAANLHASAHSITHQRVMECALSGGLPLARRTFDDLERLARGVRRHVLRDLPLDAERAGQAQASTDRAA